MYLTSVTGRITDYVRITQLEKKVAEKNNNNPALAFLKQDDNWLKTKKLQDIGYKMKSGKRLSHDEMEFLRIHDPETYKKAVKIEKEREEFRRALATCKTKEEAQRLQNSKSMELQTEAQAAGGSKSASSKNQGDLDFIAMRMMAIFDEFAEFLKSKEYVNLPNEYEKDDEDEDKKETRLPLMGSGTERNKENFTILLHKGVKNEFQSYNSNSAGRRVVCSYLS